MISDKFNLTYYLGIRTWNMVFCDFFPLFLFLYVYLFIYFHSICLLLFKDIHVKNICTAAKEKICCFAKTIISVEVKTVSAQNVNAKKTVSSSERYTFLNEVWIYSYRCGLFLYRPNITRVVRKVVFKY